MSIDSDSTNCNSLEELISRIKSSNIAWKLSKKIFGTEDPLTRTFLEQKNQAQLSLLFHPTNPAILSLDTESDYAEPVYSISLRNKQGEHTHADHIPLRIINNIKPALKKNLSII